MSHDFKIKKGNFLNILFYTVGRRGYIVDYFRKHLSVDSKFIGTSDRNDCNTEYTSGFSHCDKSYIVPSIKEERNYYHILLYAFYCKTLNGYVDLYLFIYLFLRIDKSSQKRVKNHTYWLA